MAWQDDYPALYQALAPDYRVLSQSQLEPLVRATLGEATSLDDAEGLLDDVGRAFSSAAKAVAPVAARALPGAASGALAGASLGPWGMLAGALAGGTASALSGSAHKSKTSNPVSAAAAALPAFPRASGSDSGAAIAQLLGALGSPTTQRALASMLLGHAGAPTVPSSTGKQIPVAAITNLIGLLANRASAEWDMVAPFSGEDYVSEGLDKANPEVRGDVLYSELDPVALLDSGASGEDWAEAWLDEMYDAAEADFYADFETTDY